MAIVYLQRLWHQEALIIVCWMNEWRMNKPGLQVGPPSEEVGVSRLGPDSRDCPWVFWCTYVWPHMPSWLVGASQCIFTSLAGFLCHRESWSNSNSQTNRVGKTHRELPVPWSNTRRAGTNSDPQTFCPMQRCLSFLFEILATYNSDACRGQWVKYLGAGHWERLAHWGGHHCWMGKLQFHPGHLCHVAIWAQFGQIFQVSKAAGNMNFCEKSPNFYKFAVQRLHIIM